ncbi:MAG: HPr(Ser) kinase/phosphatase [Burkholderiaceae bacterium]
MSITVADLFASCQKSLQLAWLTPPARGGEREVAPAGVEPADLVGHLNLIHQERIHVLGHAEMQYLMSLDTTRINELTSDLVAGKPPAIIIADHLDCPSLLLDAARDNDLAVLASGLSAARVIDNLRAVLGRATAATVSVHGVFMDVLGMGVLIAGESGLGKSELALELISRGHGLVADDVVEFSRIAHNAIEGRCPPMLQNLLEVRGLGLLDIRTIFGETSVRRKMRLKLIVQLVRRSQIDEEYQRLPLETLTQDVLGMPVRKMVVPVAAGRNLAVLTEGAVRSTVMQLRGIDTTAEFIERQRRMIESDNT